MQDLSYSAYLIASVLAAATPLLLATLGEIVAERSGVLNLGLEGLMLLGAMSGVAVSLHSGSAWLGLAAAAAASALLATLHAIAAVLLRADQIVSGLATGMAGAGLASILGSPLVGRQGELDRFVSGPLLALGRLPFFGSALFSLAAPAYLAVLLALVLWWIINKTRYGLELRSVGTNPKAADSAGVPVSLYRVAAVVTGGAFAGLGGASLSLWITPGYVDGMTAGMGFIALGLTILARWSPLLAIVAALFFGFLQRLPLELQGMSSSFFSGPSVGYFMAMIPYLAVILALVLSGTNDAVRPSALAQPFVRGSKVD